MWLLFLMLPAIGSLTDVQIGLIVDSRMGSVRSVMDAAIEDIKRSPVNSYNYIYSYDDSGTCAKGPNFLKAGYLLGNFYMKDKIKAVFGPMCYGDHRSASRLTTQWDILYFNSWNDNSYDYKRKTLVQMSTRSVRNVAENIYALLKAADWRRIAVFSCKDCYGNEDELATKERIEAITGYLQSNGIVITFQQKVFKNSTVEFYREKLQGIEKVARVILPFVGGTMESCTNLQLALKAENMTNAEYSTLIVMSDFQPDGISFPGKDDRTLTEAFQGSVVLYNNMDLDVVGGQMVKELLQQVGAPSGMEQIYVNIYESMFIFNALLNMSPWAEGQQFSGKTILQNLKGNLQGPFGPTIVFNKQLQRISPFLAYQIVNGTLNEIGRIARFTDGKDVCFNTDGQCLLFTAVKLELNADQPTCGFYDELCDQTGIVIIIAAVTSTVFAGVGFYIGAKRMKGTSRGSQQAAMPWVIKFSSIRIVDMSRNVTDDTSIASLRYTQDLATQSQFMSEGKLLATYQHQYCAVDRYIQNEKIVFKSDDIQLLFNMKQLNHDNVNPFLGMSFDRSTYLFVLWNHGFRGSLADWIFKPMDKRIAFAEENFKDAFVRDILKGLDYLHSSNLQFHGALTPQQCFIDTHWILKISGYGASRLLFRWKNDNSIGTVDGKPLISNYELHYVAPEFRKKLKSLIYNNRKELLILTTKEGQALDMFAFGTILYEILHKRKMLDFDDYIRSEIDDDGYIMSEQAEALLPNITPTAEEIDKDVHNDLKTLMLNCWKTDITQRASCAMARKIAEATMKMRGSLVDQMLENMQMYTKGLESMVQQRTALLEKAQKKADGLLTAMLPRPIVDDLKKGIQPEARNYKSATIMYSDIVGFTALCSESLPMEVVSFLGPLFHKFDSIIKEHDGYKLETIGDAYCVASGLPVENKLKHVANIANIALKMRKFMNEFEIPHRPGLHLHCRWGMNTGPLFAGVVGRRAPKYAAFGDTVAIAGKMESLGIPDKIQMTFNSYKLLTTHFPEFICTAREGGAVKIPGVGYLLTYWLDGVEELMVTDRAAFDKALEEHESREDKKTESPYAFHRKAPTRTSSLSSVKPRIVVETAETTL